MNFKFAIIIIGFTLASVVKVEAQCTPVSLTREPAGGTFCEGQTIYFYTDPGAQLTVNGSPFLDNGNGLVLENLGRGSYVIEAHVPNGCPSSTSFQIKAPVDGDVVVSGPTSLICQNGLNSGFSVNPNLVSDEDSIGAWMLDPGWAGEITNNGNSISVDWHPGFSGNVTVSAKAFGCGSPITGDEVFNVRPSRTTTLAGNGVICTNQNYVLTVDNPDLSPSISYLIFKGSELFHTFEWPYIEGVGLTVNATDNGDYTLQIADENSKTCPTDTVTGTVSVNRNSGSTVSFSTGSTTTFCEGDEVTFTGSGGNSIGYTWILDGSQIPNGGPPDLKGIPGYYDVVVSAYNSCGILRSTPQGSNRIRIVNDVDEYPTVTGPEQTCEGSSKFTVSADADVSFMWWVSPPEAASNIGSGNTSGSTAEGIYTWAPTFSGTAIIHVMAVGCRNTRLTNKEILIKKSNPITISPSPSAVLCEGAFVTLTASGAGGYRWLGPNGFTSDVNPLRVRVDEESKYSVIGFENTCHRLRSKAVEITMVSPSDGGVALSTTSEKEHNLVSSTAYETSTLHDYVGTIERWEYRLNSGAWTTIPNSALQTTPPTSYLPGYGSTVAFRAWVKNGSCPSVASSEVWYGWGVEPDKNYVRVLTPQIALNSITEIYDKYSDADLVSVATDYFDGTSRNVQKVGHAQSPTGKDIVVYKEYDEVGREATSYLPFTSATSLGHYKDNAQTSQLSFYASPPAAIVSDVTPVAKLIYERSPLNRLIEQGSSGEAWQPGTTRTIHREYLFNGEGQVFQFKYDEATLSVSLTAGSYYDENTLQCNKTIDEHQNDVLEYVDKEGHIICKKVKAPGDTYASTYYIYDDFGNLVVVLPPEAVTRINGN